MAKKSKSRFTAEVEDDDDDWVEDKKAADPEPDPAPEPPKKSILPPNYDLAINVPPKQED